MHRQLTALAGLAACVLFWGAVVGFGSASDDYSQMTDPISQLGAAGAPRMAAFNLLAFILPGAFLTAFGISLAGLVRPRSKVTPFVLGLAGLGLAIAGLSPGDPANLGGSATMLHLLGTGGSLTAWLAGMLILAFISRREHPGLAIGSIAALAAMIAALALYDALDAYGLVQRMTFAVFFTWYAGVSVWLLAGKPAR